MIAALARRVPDARPRVRRGVILGALSLASFLVVFDDSAVAVALPSLRRDLDLAMEQLEWTLNAYTLGLATMLMLAGKLVDRYGAQGPLVIGLGLFTAASVPAALAEGGTVLIAARAVQGMGAGFIAPASLAVVSVLFPEARRGVAIGVWAAISTIGLGAGPLLGSMIVEYLGWSGLFLINIPVGVVLIGIASSSSAIAAPVEPIGGRLDLGGAAAAGATLVLMLLAVTRVGPDGWLSAPVLVPGLGALACGVIFLAVEARAADPVVPLEAFRSRTLVGAAAVGLLSTAAMCSLFFFMSLYLQSVVGYSVLAVGVAFLPMTAVIALGAPLAGFAGSRVTPRALAVAGMGLLSLAMLALARLDDGLGLSGIVLGLTLAGVGVAMTATPVTTLALGALPSTGQGLAAALVSTARTVGLAFGVAVMGAILGDTGGGELTSRLARGLEVNAAIAAAGALAAFLLLRTARTRQTERDRPDPILGEISDSG